MSDSLRPWPPKIPTFTKIVFAISAILLLATSYSITQIQKIGPPGPQGVQGPAGPPGPTNQNSVSQVQMDNLTQRLKAIARMNVLQSCLLQLSPLAQRVESDEKVVTNAALSPYPTPDQQWMGDIQNITSVSNECYPEDKINLYADPPESLMNTKAPGEPPPTDYDVVRKYRYAYYQWFWAKQTVFLMQARIPRDMQEIAQSVAQWSRN